MLNGAQVPGVRPQGWCPECGLRSVVLTPSMLVCSSPQCDWERDRSEALENEVFSGPAELTKERLNNMRQRFGLAPQ